MCLMQFIEHPAINTLFKFNQQKKLLAYEIKLITNSNMCTNSLK